MELDPEIEIALRQYLLGTHSPDQQRQVEERLLADGTFFEELSAAEDELVDEYLRDTLPARERGRFEEHFLSTPERRAKLKFARAFGRYVARADAGREAATAARITPATEPPRTGFLRRLGRAPRVALATALAVVVLGGSWLLFNSRRDGRPTGAGHSERASSDADGVNSQDRQGQNLTPATAGGQESPATFALTLTPGLARDAGVMTKAVIPGRADTVQLRLELPSDEYRSYRAALQTVEGRTLLTGEDLMAENLNGTKLAIFNVPAKLLPTGDYQIKLSGTAGDAEGEAVGTYAFRILSR